MTKTHSLFFYGTLCHGAVLARVLGHPGEGLTSRDALLLDHVRFHVQQEDFPAVVSSADGTSVMNRSLSEEESTVRGVLVEGLSDADVALLDEFEGDEYTRAPCPVRLLDSPASSPLYAHTYLWTAPLSRLSPQIWSFEAFLRDSAHRWVGVGAEWNPDYLEVDRRRNMKGVITPRGVREAAGHLVQEQGEQLKKELDKLALENGKEQENGGAVQFGRKLAEKYWRFAPGYVNLNHGSYGAAPIPVVEALERIQAECDSAPDRFMRLNYESQLVALRARLAKFVDCDTDDLVMVTNATTGVNEVLRGMTNEWKKGDRLLCFSTSIYPACVQTLQYIVDTHPHLSLSLLNIPVSYPIPHAELIAKTRAAIEEAENDGTGRKVRLALIDSISSNPGVVVPWEELVELFREKDILSLVDGAHQIGQLPVSLRTSRPDFFVSNAHKWLMAHRSSAILYVDKKFQHLIHTIPIGHMYRSREPSANGSPGWVDEHVWSGTIDWAPYLSTTAALVFRQNVLGGEERINEWCHQLAVEGGEEVAKVLGMRTMRNARPEEGELVANMVNVELPIPRPSTFSPDDKRLLAAFWFKRLSENHNTIVPIFTHDDRYWTRLSAQVYNDMDDFRHAGQAVKRVCERIVGGEFRGADAKEAREQLTDAEQP
ncbi:hypothetical protein NBRC10512_007186 [Rhodotorula toruloides]|uniref:RHTO0S20e01442g1_1 n=2 Tax=Rhodotorula toruloides TaxID=5286 RepID=A0A061BHE7_RHOTO|nr:aminotransferase, class V/Cysteine desulfurase [Rhodotorula toruloides NP11]EMS19535.1 aminotransferase, class V/Cysteine desulfurase [Rhodotorula toruloides NP11]CDR48791.1 RHTO0S20e01442g1_1 [Rhodotorula toruloides]